MKFKYVLTSILAVGLTACGSSDGGSPSDPLGINGNWVSNCYLDNDNEYVIDKFDFSGLSFGTSFNSYDNSSCNGSPIDSGAVSGDIEIGGEITTDSGLTATEVKFIFNFKGSNQQVLDIIRLDGDEFVFGVFDSGVVYPTELDFDIILARQ